MTSQTAPRFQAHISGTKAIESESEESDNDSSEDSEEEDDDDE